jgi:hypothetical protein
MAGMIVVLVLLAINDVSKALHKLREAEKHVEMVCNG